MNISKEWMDASRESYKEELKDPVDVLWQKGLFLQRKRHIMGSCLKSIFLPIWECITEKSNIYYDILCEKVISITFLRGIRHKATLV